MSSTPDFSDWQKMMDLVKSASTEDKHALLLTMLMTPDERDVMLARVNILHELLQGELSQRQISQALGVGIATITRGSTELKNRSDEDKQWLHQFLAEQAEK